MHVTLAFLNILDSREKAVVIWVAAIVVYGTLKARRDIGSPIALLLRTMFHRKMLLLFGSAAGYCVAAVAVAQWAGLWHATAAKETVYWFCTGGITLVGQAVSHAKSPELGFHANLLGRAVRATIVIEFLVNLYVFPLPIELVLVPIILLLVMGQVIAAHDASVAAVRKPVDIAVATIGVFLLAYAAGHVIGNLSGLFTRENAETLLIAPALTFAFVPFLWAWGWISRREQQNLRRRFRTQYDVAA
jgi:hypothetical protein